LNAVVAAAGDRSKLNDIDLTGASALSWDPIPAFEDSTRIRGLALNSAQRVSAMMGKMENIGRYSWGESAQHVEKLLLFLECQAGLEFVDLAGWGGSRFVILANVRRPATETQKRAIDWFEGMQAVVKLLHPLEDGSLPSKSSLCNDANMREAKVLLTAHGSGRLTDSRLRTCLPKLLPVLPDEASAGYVMCGESTLVTFLVCEAVGQTWYHGAGRSAITSTWRNQGALGETFRAFARNLLHRGWYLHDRLGIAVMDCSVSNICETSDTIPWLLHHDIQNQMPTPRGFAFCDLGAGYDIGTAAQRIDGDVRRGNEKRDRMLSRQATTELQAKQQNRPTPRVPKSDSIGVVVLRNANISAIFQHRRSTGKGLGRLTMGTHGNRCEILAAMSAKRPADQPLTAQDCIQVDAGSFGNIIFGHVCPRTKGVDDQAYNAMMKRAAESPKAMQTVLEGFVKTGVAIKQPDTVASLANFLYWMLRTDVKNRIDMMTALCHPFISLRILSPADYMATRNDGYLFPGGLGPPKSPWAQYMFPSWIVKHIAGKGLGAVAGDSIPRGNGPVALYCALDFSTERGEAIHEWPPGRCNVSIDLSSWLALGEVPIEALRERRSPGVFFNAGDAESPNNLSLKRLEAWRDGQGLVYIPFYGLRDIAKMEEGLWDYQHTNGAAGGQFSFEDTRFEVKDP